ncbi:MAG: hypothetical protein AAF205_11820 [Pseudomonadota bacterium]
MIDHFRAHWFGIADGDASGHESDCSGLAYPARAAGKVARWSLERTATFLHHAARARLRINVVGSADATPHEISIMKIFEALATGDDDTARAQARWLVPAPAIDALLGRAKPVAELYPQMQRAA